VECVADQGRLACGIYRILKPRGSASVMSPARNFGHILMAHRTITALNTGSVHGYADFTQRWQDKSEGQMGRLLPGLVANRPFVKQGRRRCCCRPRSLERKLRQNSSERNRCIVGKIRRPSRKRQGAWLRGLEMRSNAGGFYLRDTWT